MKKYTAKFKKKKKNIFSFYINILYCIQFAVIILSINTGKIYILNHIKRENFSC